jgi:hypothetical protein
MPPGVENAVSGFFSQIVSPVAEITAKRAQLDEKAIKMMEDFMVGTAKNGMKATALFSPLEWKVVAIAIKEAGEMAQGNGWFARLLRRATGAGSSLPLADPRLDTLRRFVCEVRRRADVSEIARSLGDLGYSPNQIAAVATLAR